MFVTTIVGRFQKTEKNASNDNEVMHWWFNAPHYVSTLDDSSLPSSYIPSVIVWTRFSYFRKRKKINLADNNIVKQSNKQLVRFSNNSRSQLLLHYNKYSIIYKRKM